MRSRYALLPILLFSLSLSAQVRMPATTRVGLGELQALAAHHPDPAKLVEETQGSHPMALIHGRCMVGFLGRVRAGFDAEAFAGEHIMVGARKGSILSFRVDVRHLDLVAALPGVEYIELAGKVKPTMDRVRYATRADSVHRGIDLPQSYTGRDVLIGITDWGFDYQHPNFYDTAMTHYRVRAAWDHYRQAGPAPQGHDYGTELATPQELIAAGADTVNIYGNATHGTHVAGIAGGGGAGSAFRGIAYDAQFLFCTFLVDAAAVLDAFTWMQHIAEEDDKRLVVNMSWGLHHIGTLDGNSLISQAIDQFASEGVVFVNSAGNNGDVNFHIRRDFAGDTLRTRVQFYPYSAHPKMWGQSISMWGEAGHSFGAGVIVTNNSNVVRAESPMYHTDLQAPYLDSIIVVGNDTVYFNLTADAAHPLNGRPHFRLRVKNRSSQLKVALKATAADGRMHFWNVTELTNDVGNWGQDFVAARTGWVTGDRQYGISEPACTNGVISVAAYYSEFIHPNTGAVGGGPIAEFSSYGPTLDERVKPDVAAPGVQTGSSMSSYTDETFTSIRNVDLDGRTFGFARMSGTSMSSPVVAGVAALLLEAAPTLTPQEVKDAIMRTARQDGNTGAIPVEGSVLWGMGKVNAHRAVREVLGLNGVEERGMQSLNVWPNPSDGEVWVRLGERTGPMRVTVADVTGRIVAEANGVPSDPHRIDMGGWADGVYTIRCLAGDSVRTAVVVKE